MIKFNPLLFNMLLLQGTLLTAMQGNHSGTKPVVIEGVQFQDICDINEFTKTEQGKNIINGYVKVMTDEYSENKHFVDGTNYSYPVTFFIPTKGRLLLVPSDKYNFQKFIKSCATQNSTLYKFNRKTNHFENVDSKESTFSQKLYGLIKSPFIYIPTIVVIGGTLLYKYLESPSLTLETITEEYEEPLSQDPAIKLID